jgi:hypothetical protein
MKKERQDQGWRQGKVVSSEQLAISLVEKMVAYERRLDAKEDKTPAETRHVEYLRALRRVGLFGMN